MKTPSYMQYNYSDIEMLFKDEQPRKTDYLIEEQHEVVSYEYDGNASPELLQATAAVLLSDMGLEFTQSPTLEEAHNGLCDLETTETYQQKVFEALVSDNDKDYESLGKYIVDRLRQHSHDYLEKM